MVPLANDSSHKSAKCSGSSVRIKNLNDLKCVNNFLIPGNAVLQRNILCRNILYSRLYWKRKAIGYLAV